MTSSCVSALAWPEHTTAVASQATRGWISDQPERRLSVIALPRAPLYAPGVGAPAGEGTADRPLPKSGPAAEVLGRPAGPAARATSAHRILRLCHQGPKNRDRLREVEVL